jgi:hypothetical protein
MGFVEVPLAYEVADDVVGMEVLPSLGSALQ